MTGLLRESKLWDKQLETGLPDSRLRDPDHKRVYRAHMWWEPVFCADCGHNGGLVTADYCPHVFYLCDACATKEVNRLRTATMIEIPESVLKPELPSV